MGLDLTGVTGTEPSGLDENTILGIDCDMMGRWR